MNIKYEFEKNENMPLYKMAMIAHNYRMQSFTIIIVSMINKPKLCDT